MDGLPYRTRQAVKVTLTMDKEIVATAKKAGVNMSRFCEYALLAIIEASK